MTTQLVAAANLAPLKEVEIHLEGDTFVPVGGVLDPDGIIPTRGKIGTMKRSGASVMRWPFDENTDAIACGTTSMRIEIPRNTRTWGDLAKLLAARRTGERASFDNEAAVSDRW